MMKLFNLKNIFFKDNTSTSTSDNLIMTVITKETFNEFKDEFVKVMEDNNMSYKLPIDFERYFLEYFKLESQNEIVGFTLTEKKMPLNLSKFAISKKWQNRGIGKVALKLWEDNNNKIFLKLNVYNYMIHAECDKSTIGFYKKQGYKQYGGYKREENGKMLDRIFINKFIVLKV